MVGSFKTFPKSIRIWKVFRIISETISLKRPKRIWLATNLTVRSLKSWPTPRSKTRGSLDVELPKRNQWFVRISRIKCKGIFRGSMTNSNQLTTLTSFLTWIQIQIRMTTHLKKASHKTTTKTWLMENIIVKSTQPSKCSHLWTHFTMGSVEKKLMI